MSILLFPQGTPIGVAVRNTTVDILRCAYREICSEMVGALLGDKKLPTLYNTATLISGKGCPNLIGGSLV